MRIKSLKSLVKKIMLDNSNLSPFLIASYPMVIEDLVYSKNITGDYFYCTFCLFLQHQFLTTVISEKEQPGHFTQVPLCFI